MKHVRPTVEKTRPNTPKNPDVDRLEEDVNRLNKRWGNCCMQVVERLRSCEAACELLEKYNMSYTSESNWMDELDSKLRNLEELEAARAKEAWEKHVVSTHFWLFRGNVRQKLGFFFRLSAFFVLWDHCFKISLQCISIFKRDSVGFLIVKRVENFTWLFVIFLQFTWAQIKLDIRNCFCFLMNFETKWISYGLENNLM